MALQFEILIVDDDVELASSLQDILEVEGYGTALAGDGQTALALCHEKMFDLGFIDIKLPDMPGVKLVGELARLSPQMEYIIITGYASLETAVEAVKQKNIIAYETKPFDMDNLLALIRQVVERKRTEEALRKSETRYRNLVEDTSAGVIIVDLEGRFVYFNSAFRQLVGYEEEEILGKPLAKLIHPDDKKRVMTQFQPPYSPGRLGSEFRMIHKEGNIVYMYSSPTVLRYGNEIAGFSAIITDITERKRMERNLDERMKELRCLYSVANIAETPGISLDEICNQVVNLLPQGWRYPEITSAKININGSEFKTQNYRETGWKQSADIRINGATVGVVEVNYLEMRQDMAEELFLKEERLLIDAVAERLGDVTEHKHSEELLKTISESSPTGVYIVQDGKFKYVNRQFQQSMGYREDELLSMDPLNYVFPADRDAVRTCGGLISVEKLSCPYEYRVIDKASQVKWVMETAASIQYRGKQATLGNCMDITERKLLEKKIIEYEELSKLKSDLLSTVSHELRSPLAAIKGYSTMMLDYDQRLGDEEKQEYLQSIDRATDRLTELVDHLLDMSRLDAGLLKLDKVPTSIYKLIKEAVAEGRIKAPKYEIVASVSKGLPKLTVDARRIRQVLDNLLNNACKYSKEGTKVVVSAKRVGHHLLISVADQGIGIPANEIERVFDRMYRIEQRLTDKVEGMGLGLAICKGLVEAHGGSIWMVSEEGRGSKCSFTLPL